MTDLGKLSNSPKLMTIPSPTSRPGDAADYSWLSLSEPGEVGRPELDTLASEMSHMATSLVRVMDDMGRAVGPWAKHIDNNKLKAGLRHMMELRALDKRMIMAQRQGKTSVYFQHRGEEAVTCAARMALEEGDMCFPSHRSAGLLIASGYPIEQMINQIFSNSADPLRGRQMPIMYSSKDHGYFSASGNLGTQFPQGVGWAMASAISGNDRIASSWIGEGATAGSDFHAALSFASTFRPPVIMNVVNNHWAISMFHGVSAGCAESFAFKGLGYGIPSIRVDGNDYLAVHAVSKWATERARAGHGPTLIEFVTYRIGAHSTSDDPSGYRSDDSDAAWPLGDPIERLSKHLIELGEWSAERQTQAEAEVAEDIKQIQKRAEAHGAMGKGARVSPASMFENVFEEMPLNLKRQRQEAGY